MTAPMPRAAVLAIAAYVPGESQVAGANRVIKLASNEGAFGPPPGAQEAYRQVAGNIHRYPDGGSGALRRAIGARYGLDHQRIVCGTGSDELIQHLCHIYAGPGTDILMSMHGFTMYQIAGTYSGARVLKVPERNLTADVDAVIAAATPRTRVVFLANPNNPTGSLLPRQEVERLRAGLAEHVLLVIDAAYADYVTDPVYEPGIALVNATENTVMLRTFSKVFGMGGMRVGWAYAPPAVIDAINRVRGVFNVNIAAQAAGVAALAEPGWVERSVAHNTEWRARLAAALQAAGIKAWPSHGNFILADFGTPARARAADAFLRGRGIIVRDLVAYDLARCLRITVGTGEECSLVADALATFMASGAGGRMAEVLFRRLALIGIGLIGSSVARVVRERGLAGEVVASARTEATLRRVRELGIADRTEIDPARAVEGADCVMLCVPVGASAAVVEAIAPHLVPGTVLTEVGSTKQSVIRDVGPLVPAGVHFVPGHPLAGTEFSGPDAGFATLFEGRWCLLTPPPGTDEAAVERVAALWRAAGSMVAVMEPAHHDRVLAIVSHLPHLIAFTICGTADDLEGESRQEVLQFAATGFRDFTRIAASDPVMWRDVFLNNREALLEMLARFTEDAQAMARAVRWGDAAYIEDRILRGRKIRRSLIELKQA